ncbi:hypothetical protein GINT2_001754 [Glugoides intestinalis]
MNRSTVKDIWFYSNICLFINYSLTILKLFVALPIPRLPSFFNSAFLIVSYSLTFEALLSNLKTTGLNAFIKKICSQPNAYCIALFFCFPPNIILFPFYILGMYHIATFVTTKKERFGSSFIFEYCVFLNNNTASIGRLSLFFQVLLVPVAFILFVVRSIGLMTFLAYVLMVRHQYMASEHMRAVVGEILQYLNGLSMNMPDEVKMNYLGVMNYIQSQFRKEKNVKEKQ